MGALTRRSFPVANPWRELFYDDTALGAWAPRMDIVETEGAYEIEVDLPGVPREDIKLTLENRTLTISGEKKDELEEKKAEAHRVERFFGRFSRSVHLGKDVDSEKVEASYKDGVLKVCVPKQEEAKAREITISD